MIDNQIIYGFSDVGCSNVPRAFIGLHNPRGHLFFGESNMSKFRRKNPILCSCGCGMLVTWDKWKRQWSKFLRGHNLRINNPMKKIEIKNKISGKNHYLYGKRGKEHHLYGRKFPQMSGDNNPMRRPETAAKFKGNNNPMRQPEIAEKVAKQNRGKKRPDSFQRMLGKNNPMFGICGLDHPKWKGGESIKPYCHIWTDQEYKQSIRDRDNNTCQNPHCKCNCNFNHKLSLHHINGNKLNCHPWNLISLCRGCNTIAEGNKNISRKKWQNLYQNIMTEKYEYE